MSDIITKVNIMLGDCVLEFSGSETFVQKQINEFKELIHGKLRTVKPVIPKGKQEKKPRPADVPPQASIANQYPNVIEYDNGAIDILKVSGNNNADKTKSLALMYSWSKENFDNERVVPTQEIRKQCETHGCLDAANFSSILRRIDKSYVVLKGRGKSQTIKLTAPGKKEAKIIIESLNEES